MTFVAALALASWLGLITSISPCPLATNIAAVSYLSRRRRARGATATAGVISYAFGRAIAYVLIGAAIAWGLAAAPRVSLFLQHALEPFVGPILVIVGLVLLGWIPLRLNFGAARPGTAEALADRGLQGAFALGVLFALTFCPISAALFFGSLLPLALSSESPLPLFATYGIATAVPVAVVALLLSRAAGIAASGMNNVQRWQGRIQAITAWLIVAIGAYQIVWGPLGRLWSRI